MLGRHLAEFRAAELGQPDHLDAPIGLGGPAIEMTGIDQALDEPGHIAVRHHHALGDVRQGHAVRGLVELSHQVEPRQRDVETLAQPGADLTLDQRGAGEEPQPQPQLLGMVLGQLDGLSLGIKSHDGITCGRSAQTGETWEFDLSGLPGARKNVPSPRHRARHDNSFNLQAIGAALACAPEPPRSTSSSLAAGGGIRLGLSRTCRLVRCTTHRPEFQNPGELS